MSEKKIRSGDEAARVETRGRRQVEEGGEAEIEVIDLGRASERTRGSYSGFIVEPSAFPLREV